MAPETTAGPAAVLADLEAGDPPVLLSDLRDEPYMPRPKGRKLDKSVPFRWAKAGKRGAALQTLRTPTGIVTTRSAVLRFFAALTGAGDPAAHPPWRPPGRRRQEVARAVRELAEAGI